MSGDWIKVEKSTARKPEIFGIAALLNLSLDAAFGACVRFWFWCDDQMSDGCAPRVTTVLLDDAIGIRGFAQALIDVGWLQVRSGSLVVPKFDRHLSESAKKRTLSRERMKNSRESKRNAERNKCCAENATEASPEREYREEINTSVSTHARERPPSNRDSGFFAPPPEAFESFWQAYPRKAGRGPAIEHWESSVAIVQSSKGCNVTQAETFLLSKARELAASKLATSNKRFLPKADTFLIEQRFFDDPSLWEQGNERQESTGAGKRKNRFETNINELEQFVEDFSTGIRDGDSSLVCDEADN